MAYSINIGESFIPMKYIKNYYKQNIRNAYHKIDLADILYI